MKIIKCKSCHENIEVGDDCFEFWINGYAEYYHESCLEFFEMTEEIIKDEGDDDENE